MLWRAQVYPGVTRTPDELLQCGDVMGMNGGSFSPKVVAAGLLTVLQEKRNKQGYLAKVFVESLRHVESGSSVISRALDARLAEKNILAMNGYIHALRNRVFEC